MDTKLADAIAAFHDLAQTRRSLLIEIAAGEARQKELEEELDGAVKRFCDAKKQLLSLASGDGVDYVSGCFTITED